MIFVEANYERREAWAHFIKREEGKIISRFNGIDFVEKYSTFSDLLKNISYSYGMKYLDQTNTFLKLFMMDRDIQRYTKVYSQIASAIEKNCNAIISYTKNEYMNKIT